MASVEAPTVIMVNGVGVPAVAAVAPARVGVFNNDRSGVKEIVNKVGSTVQKVVN